MDRSIWARGIRHESEDTTPGLWPEGGAYAIEVYWGMFSVSEVLGKGADGLLPWCRIVDVFDARGQFLKTIYAAPYAQYSMSVVEGLCSLSFSDPAFRRALEGIVARQ